MSDRTPLQQLAELLREVGPQGRERILKAAQQGLISGPMWVYHLLQIAFECDYATADKLFFKGQPRADREHPYTGMVHYYKLKGDGAFIRTQLRDAHTLMTQLPEPDLPRKAPNELLEAPIELLDRVGT